MGGGDGGHSRKLSIQPDLAGCLANVNEAAAFGVAGEPQAVRHTVCRKPLKWGSLSELVSI